MLRRESDIKNTQITQQLEVITKQAGLIDGLSERLREGNILIGTLQQRLALPEARAIPAAEPVKPKPVPATKSEKGTPAPTKSAKPKKGFLSRLFR